MFNLIYAKQLKQRLSAQGSDLELNSAPLILLDVRQPYEHDTFHLANSLLIPLAELPERINELDNFKSHAIIVYCQAGVRSALACKYLAACGFSHIYNLADGVNAW